MRCLAPVYDRVVQARARHIVAGVCFIVGLSRVGLLSRGPLTTFPSELYGALLLAAALALALTAGAVRSGIPGRVTAGLAACVLAGFAADFWVTSRGITTALMLYWLAAWLVWEAVAEHGC